MAHKTETSEEVQTTDNDSEEYQTTKELALEQNDTETRLTKLNVVNNLLRGSRISTLRSFKLSSESNEENGHWSNVRSVTHTLRTGVFNDYKDVRTGIKKTIFSVNDFKKRRRNRYGGGVGG